MPTSHSHSNQPRRALLLLVSHSAARVLPTIRSRCRLLALRPLTAGDVARAVVIFG